MEPEVTFFLICVGLLFIALLGMAGLRLLEWQARRRARHRVKPNKSRDPRRPAGRGRANKPRRLPLPARRAPAQEPEAIVPLPDAPDYHTLARLLSEAIEIIKQQQAEYAALELEVASFKESLTPRAQTWLSYLLAALHLLVIGHSGGGKTTLLHHLATRWTEAGVQVMVCDPDAAPGMWPRCTVYGYQENFQAIESLLKAVAAEFERRSEERGAGRQRRFQPLYVVLDEYQQIVRKLPHIRPLIEDMLERGRKRDIHLVIGVPDDQVGTLGFDGHGAVRKHFSYVVELFLEMGQRTALITPTGKKQGESYVVPHLPDPEDLAEAEQQRREQERERQGNSVGLLSSLLRIIPGRRAASTPALNESPPPETAETATVDAGKVSGKFPVEKTDFSALQRDFSLPFDSEQIAQIVVEIESGKIQTEVVTAMPGYAGRHHKRFVAYYQAIKNHLQIAS